MENSKQEKITELAKKIKMFGKNVAIVRNESAGETASGFTLTKESQEKKVSGTVYGIGKDVEEAQVGDNVVFDKYDVTEIQVQGVNFLIVKEPSIHFKIEQ